MPRQHTELAFEKAIENHLLTVGGYEKGDPNNFDRKRGLDVGTFVSFIENTQPKEWSALVKLHKGRAGEVLIDDLCKATGLSAGRLLKSLKARIQMFWQDI